MTAKPSVDVDELFAGIDIAESSASSGAPAIASSSQSIDAHDPTADLEELLKRPVSRPATPKVAPLHPIKAAGSRTSDEKARVLPNSRKSGESSRSYHEATSATELDSSKGDAAVASISRPIPLSIAVVDHSEPKASTGGSWWGGILSAASQAAKQAESTIKDIQSSPEAQKWTAQLQDNVANLRSQVGDLTTKTLVPSLSTILHTIAPPISSHERLQIHITHDLKGYPSLDPLIYQVFARVMSQVEGGDLLVIQRGQESTVRRNSEAGYSGSGRAGWSDGPWWRSTDARDIGLAKGLAAGTKLARVSAETYATDFHATRGGLEKASLAAVTNLTEDNPIRRSDVFLAIQPISHTADPELFANAGSPVQENPGDHGSAPMMNSDTEDSVSFAVYVYDPVHELRFHTVSQSLPERWISWLDAAAPDSPQTQSPSRYGDFSHLPPAIAAIVEAGGVDPREWVAEWVEQTLELSVGNVAQRYVARRMGVGEVSAANLGNGVRKDTLESGGGEAARAI